MKFSNIIKKFVFLIVFSDTMKIKIRFVYKLLLRNFGVFWYFRGFVAINY